MQIKKDFDSHISLFNLKRSFHENLFIYVYVYDSHQWLKIVQEYIKENDSSKKKGYQIFTFSFDHF